MWTSIWMASWRQQQSRQQAGWPLLHPSCAVRARHAGQVSDLLCAGADAVVRWLARSRRADEWSRLACVHGHCSCSCSPVGLDVDDDNDDGGNDNASTKRA